MEENVIQIKSGMKINIDVSVKNKIHVEKTLFEILLHAAANISNI